MLSKADILGLNTFFDNVNLSLSSSSSKYRLDGMLYHKNSCLALAHDMLSCPSESGSWHQSLKLSNNSWIRETKEQAVMDVSGYQLHRIL